MLSAYVLLRKRGIMPAATIMPRIAAVPYLRSYWRFFCLRAQPIVLESETDELILGNDTLKHCLLTHAYLIHDRRAG